jgi:SAM-dependent methyltransferase
MNGALLELLRCPACGGRVTCEPDGPAGGPIESATLSCAAGHAFPVRDGIPRFVAAPADEGQAQTARSFGFKWQQLWGHDGRTRAFYQDWFLRRFGFESFDALAAFLAAKRCALDAGTGNGQSARWYAPLIGGRWIGVDISASVDVARRQLPASATRDLVQADIMRLPFADATFDFVLSDGVLHHTPSTERALASVARLLRPGGEILFYVYRRKGAIREFSDDHVRGIVSPLEPQQAWEALKPITRLGESLAGAHATIRVPEAIPMLGIAAGDYDLQRFVYDHILKLFWNDAFTFDENHHVNFDWFHPRYAHRQTEREVARWCDALALDIVHEAVEVSGISVRAVKR